MRHPARAIPLCLLLTCPTAVGQTSGAAGQAVDANVSDVDPLAASLRRVEPGNAQHSFNARLTTTDFGAGWTPYNRPNGSAEDRKFRYTSPGLTALIDRPDYLVATDEGVGLNVQPRRDGEQFMLIPANTVFSLTPYTLKRQEADLAPPPINLVDNRLNLRVDTGNPQASRPISTPGNGPVLGSLEPRPITVRTPHTDPTAPTPTPSAREGLDRRVFPSTVDQRTVIHLVDRKTRAKLWSMEVPVGEKLVVFTPVEGPAEHLIWERRPLADPSRTADGTPKPPIEKGTIDVAGHMFLFDIEHPRIEP